MRASRLRWENRRDGVWEWWSFGNPPRPAGTPPAEGIPAPSETLPQLENRGQKEGRGQRPQLQKKDRGHGPRLQKRENATRASRLRLAR